MRRMPPPGWVRLGNLLTFMCHCAAAAVNSELLLSPFRNRQTPPAASFGAASPSNTGKGANARAVTSFAGGNSVASIRLA